MHPLVEPCRTTLAAFQESPYSSDFLKTLKRSTLDVHISRAELDRGMAVMNAILVGLERCGYPVEIAGAREPVQWVDFKPKDPKKSGLCYPSNWWNPWPPTIVRIGTLAIGLSFFEIMEEVLVKEVKNKWIPVGDDPIPTTKRGVPTIRTQTRNMPGGRLAVRAYSPYPGAPWEQFWCEVKRGEWASAPPSIVRILELAAPTIADLVEKAWKKHEEDQRRWEVECKARKEMEALARQEEARIKEIKRREKAFQKSQEELMNIVKEWARAKRVEGFFSEILSKCSEAGGMNKEEGSSMSNERLSERIGLARNLLGGTNALVRFLAWRTPEERISEGED
jgi:hypothetical protein